MASVPSITVADIVEVRGGGLVAAELLSLAASSSAVIPSCPEGVAFGPENVYIHMDGSVEICPVSSEMVPDEFHPPEWRIGQSDPIASSVYCLGAILRWGGAMETRDADLFSLVNVLTVEMVGTRPTPVRMAQMARNQLKGKDASAILAAMFIEILGDGQFDDLSSVDSNDEPTKKAVESDNGSLMDEVLHASETASPPRSPSPLPTINHNHSQPSPLPSLNHHTTPSFTYNEPREHTYSTDEDDIVHAVDVEETPVEKDEGRGTTPSSSSSDEAVYEEPPPPPPPAPLPSLPSSIRHSPPSHSPPDSPIERHPVDAVVIHSRPRPPSLRDLPLPLPPPAISRRNSLALNRISGRGSRRKPKKTRAVPEFFETDKQAPIRLKAPSKKKKTFLNRVEATMVFVHLLNGQVIQVSCRSDATAFDIFSVVVSHTNVTESIFFGLCILRDGEQFFLDDEHKLEKFAPSGWKSSLADHPAHVYAYNMFLRFRFYPTYIDFIKTPATLHELYLQLRHDILEGRIEPKRDEAFDLAALALQAEFSDRPPPAVTDYFDVKHYLPLRLITEDPARIRHMLCELHSHYTGTPTQEAEMKLIQTCQRLPDYGCHTYRVFHSKEAAAGAPSPLDPDSGSPMWLGIQSRGVSLLEQQGDRRVVVADHPWQNTHTLQFDRKKLVIVEIGDSQTLLYTDHHSKSAYFVRFAASQHRFMMKMRQWKNQVKNDKKVAAMPDVAIEGSQHSVEQPPPSPPPAIHHHDVAELVEDVDGSDVIEITLIKNPATGLGLTLVDGHLNKVPGVYVKSMTGGGPGELAGLAVGDRILSVNGQSLAGKDRHVAVSLVKASRPTVQLVVARLDAVVTNTLPDVKAHLLSPSSKPSGSRTPPAPRRTPQKRVRAVSDFGAIGDTLPALNSEDLLEMKDRQKDDSDEEGEYRIMAPSLYEPQDEMDEHTKPLQKIVHRRKSDLGWSGHLDDVGEESDDEETVNEVILDRNESGSLGIQIASSEGQARIQAVTAHPALGNPLIAEGDVLVHVNGRKVAGCTHKEVVALLREGDRVTLGLAKSGTQAIRVVLDKSTTGSLGLSLAKRMGAEGVFIRMIGADSAAEQEGTLRVGDRVYRVAGENVSDESPTRIVERLKAAHGPVEIVVRRTTASRPPSSQSGTSLSNLQV